VIPLRATAVVMVVVSGLLISTHFFRSGDYVLAVAGLAFPALLAIRRRFARRLVQLFLVLAGAEWIRTLVLLAMERNAYGQPWIRMALILGAVAALAAVSAALIGRGARSGNGAPRQALQIKVGGTQDG
jgi:hypothetical protein